MMDDDKIDFGSVQINKKVIADIAAVALSEIEGVSLIPQNFVTKIIESLGRKSYSGITVEIDKNQQVTLLMRVQVRYGKNVSDAARHIQDVVRNAVERTADMSIKDIHVNVEGIERGQAL